MQFGRHLSEVIILSFIIITVSPVHAQNSASYDSLTRELITASEPEDKISAMLALSQELEGINPQKSIKYAQDAYNLSVNHGLIRENVRCLIQLGFSYVRVGNYQMAFESAESAIELAYDPDSGYELAKAKSIMALIYYELGDYESSARYDFENLAYYEQINDQKQVGLTLGNIGIDFISQNNYEKGLDYLKESFEIAKKNNDLHGMAYQYNNIAGVYSEYFKDNELAIDYYEEALKINKDLADTRQEGIYLMNIGNCFSKLDNNDSSLAYYNKANEIFKKISNQSLYSECQILLGNYYLKNNEYQKSLEYADTALNISLQNDFREMIKDASGLCHKIYLRLNDTIEAYKYAVIENQYKDSLFLEQNQQEIYKLEFQYNFEKLDKARQIARQKKENLLIITILSLISGIIILVLIISRYRIKSKNITLEKQAVETELVFKNKELTINLLSLIKKNEMLSDISRNLAEIGKGSKSDETKATINRLNRTIRSNADDKILKEFTVRFQEIHSGFYESLLTRFPDLTKNELKLCAFLRLNMSSKEISDLTGQRIPTIDHARYRLRKKLGISNSEVNITGFLSQF